MRQAFKPFGIDSATPSHAESTKKTKPHVFFATRRATLHRNLQVWRNTKETSPETFDKRFAFKPLSSEATRLCQVEFTNDHRLVNKCKAYALYQKVFEKPLNNP